jgi:N-glycosylase/DNA lyase
MKLDLSEDDIEDLEISIAGETTINDQVMKMSREIQLVFDTIRRLSRDSPVAKKVIKRESKISDEETLSAVIKLLQQNGMIESTGRGGGWTSTYQPCEQRINSVVDGISTIGYEGIIKFDKKEPEYNLFLELSDEYDKEPFLRLLGIIAATADYQLADRAQQFWKELKTAVYDHGHLNSLEDVETVIREFMNADVNKRLNSQKIDRIDRIFEHGFPSWFVRNHQAASPISVWEEIANALNNKMDKKTIVFAMKVYDIISLIRTGSYLDFPKDIPIPCDVQVKRVARSAGIVESDDNESVMNAWAEVLSRVNDNLDQPISLLRIDSIVWQSGQIIGECDGSKQQAEEALKDYYNDVGISNNDAKQLVKALTYEI